MKNLLAFILLLTINSLFFSPPASGQWYKRMYGAYNISDLTTNQVNTALFQANKKIKISKALCYTGLGILSTGSAIAIGIPIIDREYTLEALFIGIPIMMLSSIPVNSKGVNL